MYEDNPLVEDPRRFDHLFLGELRLDKQTQREVDEDRVKRMAHEWDWALAEAFTVTPDGEQGYFVVEGQNRFLALRLRAPSDTLVPCLILPARPREARAQVALSIYKGRRGHSSCDRWDLAVNAGKPHEVAAQKALDRLDLRIGKGASGHTITAAAAVAAVVHAGHRTPEEGAEILETTLRIIMEAFPEPEDGVHHRFDGTLIRGLGGLIGANPQADLKRLTEVMGKRLLRLWLAEAQSGIRREKWRCFGDAVLREYNKFLRNPDRELSW